MFMKLTIKVVAFFWATLYYKKKIVLFDGKYSGKKQITKNKKKIEFFFICFYHYI